MHTGHYNGLCNYDEWQESTSDLSRCYVHIALSILCQGGNHGSSTAQFGIEIVLILPWGTDRLKSQNVFEVLCIEFDVETCI